MSRRRGRPRLLVIVNYFPPDVAGGARVYEDMCRGLAELGWDVTVRAAYPFYPEWTDKSGRNGWRVWHYEDEGLHVERYGLFIPRSPNSLSQRLVHELSLLLSYLRAVPRSRGYDVVMAYCPTVSTVAIGALTRLMFRRPLWLNVQDLAAEAAAGVGLVKAGWLSRLFLGVQRWLFNRADVWSTISPVMLDRIAVHRRRGQPLLMIPNWLDRPLATEIAKLHDAGGREAPHRPVRLLYAGNLGMKQNLLALLQRLHHSDARFEFRVHGAGAQEANIRAWLDEVGDPRFSFGPLLDAAGFAAALFRADYFVITEGSDAGASFMPSKLVAGVTAGVPLLTVSDPDSPLGREVTSAELGPWFGWERLDDAVAFVAAGAGDDARHRAWSDNALRRAKDFDRDALIGQFAEQLRAMVR
jgi:colanic acid biosynthesis glycosyl transferase WcaI